MKGSYKMIKKKFIVNEIEIDGKKHETGFTDESYIIVNIPSMAEKVQIGKKAEEAGVSGVEQTMELASEMLAEIYCDPVDGSDLVCDFETLSCYQASTCIIQFLASLMANGYVPKKILTD
jgi:hypothetical protein